MKMERVWVGKRPVVKGYVSITERAECKRVGHFHDKGPKRGLEDQEIREMRALFDFADWKLRDIAKRYGVDTESCRRYVDGLTRAGLQHSKEDLPNG